MKRPLRTAAVVVVGIAILAAGCGGDDGSASGSTSAAGDARAATKPEFIFSASTICVNERKGTRWRGSAYRRDHRSEGWSTAVLARKTKTAVLLETAEAEIAGIRQLPRPPADAEEIKEMLDAMQAAVRDARRGQAQTSSEVVEYLSRANGDLQAYGLGNCTHR